MERGILRWQDVTQTVRRAAVRGLFGGNHRVSQLPDGSWSIGELLDEVDTFTPYARRVGDHLYMPHINFGGQPIELGSTPWTADPEPFFDLTTYLTTGWIIMVGEVAVSEAEILPPMAVSLSVGSMPTSTATLLRVPLAMVKGRLVLSPRVRLES